MNSIPDKQQILRYDVLWNMVTGFFFFFCFPYIISRNRLLCSLSSIGIFRFRGFSFNSHLNHSVSWVETMFECLSWTEWLNTSLVFLSHFLYMLSTANLGSLGVCLMKYSWAHQRYGTVLPSLDFCSEFLGSQKPTRSLITFCSQWISAIQILKW